MPEIILRADTTAEPSTCLQIGQNLSLSSVFMPFSVVPKQAKTASTQTSVLHRRTPSA